MKKTIAVILASLLLTSVCVFAVSCAADGADKTADVTIDVSALAERIATEITYADSLYELDDYVVDMLYECGDITVASAAWSGTGATAEAVAVFEAADESGAEEVVAALEKYKLARSVEFDRYVAAEIEKIKSCIIRRIGKYVVYSVSPDSDAVGALIDSYVESQAQAAE